MLLPLHSRGHYVGHFITFMESMWTIVFSGLSHQRGLVSARLNVITFVVVSWDIVVQSTLVITDSKIKLQQAATNLLILNTKKKSTSRHGDIINQNRRHRRRRTQKTGSKSDVWSSHNRSPTNYGMLASRSTASATSCTTIEKLIHQPCRATLELLSHRIS